VARFGDGLAVDADVVRAAGRATADALEPLGTLPPDLVCVFVCTPDADAVEGVASRVADLTGAHHVLGCTAGGVIGARQGVEQTTAVSVWAATLPETRIRTFHLEVIRTADSLAVVGMPDTDVDDQVCLLLADPYSFPADGFVEQSNASLPGLPFAGGLATGPRGAGSTRLIVDGRVVDRGAVGAVLGGGVAVRTVVSQGCRPVGPDLVVTRAEHNVLLELAGKPALAKVEEILRALPPEDQALASRGLHLGVVMDEYADEHGRGDFLIRGVLGADRERGGVIVGDVVPVGRTVRFQVRDAESADEDLRLLLGAARTAEPAVAGVAGALLFSCNGRGAGLFPSADHDVVTLHETLAPVPTAGFFAAGEIGAVAGRNYLHGFTASIVTFT
jgi:small ligand-binding sensory domain FIST